MVWLPDANNFEDMFIRFDRIHERDGRTDRRTLHDGIGRACIASRGENLPAEGTQGPIFMECVRRISSY